MKAAVKYLKIDWMRSKSQFKLMALFLLCAAMFTLNASMAMVGPCYLFFIALILAVYPFTMEQTSESGFINMLPGKSRDRVAGRFLYGGILYAFSLILGTVLIMVRNRHDGQEMFEGISLLAAAAGMSLILGMLQNILMYAIGKGKSQQLMAVIRLVPAFVMFFGVTVLLERIKDGSTSILSYVLEHKEMLSYAVLGSGIILYIAGVYVSTAIVERKDFS